MQRRSSSKGMSHSDGGSSGNFSGGFSSSHGFSGSSGAFPSSSYDRPNRADDFFFVPTGSSWGAGAGRQLQRSTSRKGRQGSSRLCHAVPPIFALFGSLWLIFGFYGSKGLELGLRYSRLFQANSLVVKEIEIQSIYGAKGPSFYGFSRHPALTEVIEWSNNYDISVEGQHHQEWAFWLNRGSKVKLAYWLDEPTSYLLIVILKGEENFNEWLKEPRDPAHALSWHNVHESGNIEFAVDTDDDYYIALGNLHDQSVKSHLRIHSVAKVYNTEKADFQCSFLGDSCRKKVSLFGPSFAVLTTPQRPLGGVDAWNVKVVYHSRWATYIFAIGLVGAVSVFFFLRRKKKSTSRNEAEHDPLIVTTVDSPDDHKASSSHNEGIKPSVPVLPSPFTNIDPQRSGKGEVSEEQLCAVCLDAKKDSFFDPCGHCATCHNCGLRIIEEGTSSCPICRQKVEKVRRLYDS